MITKFINVDPICKHCGVDFETIEHALRDCHGVAECWSSLGLRMPIPSVGEPMKH